MKPIPPDFYTNMPHWELKSCPQNPYAFLRWLTALETGLVPGTSPTKSIRRISYLAHEFDGQLKRGLTLVETLKQLNHYFFDTKKFQLSSPSEYASPSEILLSSVVKSKCAHPILLAQIYRAILEHLCIPMSTIYIPGHCLVKVNGSEDNLFINLTDDHEILFGHQAISLLNRVYHQAGYQKTANLMDPLNNQDLAKLVLILLRNHYHEKQDHRSELALLNLLVLLDKNNIQWLGERALVLAQEGNTKESLCDFKRYFAFVPVEEGPTHLVDCYKKLQRRITSTGRHLKVIENTQA